MMQEQSRSGIGYLETTLLPAQEGDVLELDEVWSFVLRKSQQVWIWLAMCRRTRQIVAWMPGPRDHNTLRQLWNKIPDAYKTGTCFTDFWNSYSKIIPKSSTEPAPSKKEKPTTSNASTAPSDRACRAWSGGLSPFPSATSGTIASSDSSSSTTINAKPKPTYDKWPNSNPSPPKRPLPKSSPSKPDSQLQQNRRFYTSPD